MKIANSLELVFWKPILRIIDLVYPKVCAACARDEPIMDGIFCVKCLSQLSFTQDHQIRDNPFEQHFWGRVDISKGHAMLYLVPGGVTQRLIHQIKYHGRKNFAEIIGLWYGKLILDANTGENLTLPYDMVIPVPLHWKKQKKRGYNQSDYFARGLAKALSIELSTHNLVRIKPTQTQTNKSRIERMDNMEDAFYVKSPGRLRGRNVLLVDDVLTTGATLEACARKIQTCEPSTISMATIAMGRI